MMNTGLITILITKMLRTHLIICSILLLLCIPIYLLDHYWLKSSGGNWISLDFSNFLVRAYLIFLGVYFTISTIAVINFHNFSLLKIHLLTALFALVLMVVGFVLFNKFQDNKYNKNETAKNELRKNYFNDIRLVRWWFVPDAKNPKEIHVDLETAAAGRFAAYVTGRGNGDTADNIFSSDGEEQHLVKAGEHIHYVFPLTINNPGQANNIEFTFHLFKHPPGEAGPDDVSKIFKKSVTTNDDGTYFYGNLIPPLDGNRE